MNDLKEADRDFPTVSGIKPEFELTLPQIQQKAPLYALRLLQGAKVMPGVEPGTVQILSCAQEFFTTTEAFEIYERVKQRVLKELELRGISPPYNTEDVIRIIHSAAEIAEEECRPKPEKLKVYFLRGDDSGVGFYRVRQPIHFLKNTNSILAEESNWLHFSLGRRYDVIVASRLSNPGHIGILRNLKEAGHIVVYECDDLLSEVPGWNKLKEAIDQENIYREFYIQHCDAIITSTEELKAKLGRQSVTHVCHNGINPTFWPMKVADQDVEQIRIMWAGSSTHRNDLKMIVPMIKKVIGRYGKKVKFVFVSYMPEDFSCVVSNSDSMRLAVRPEYRDYITLEPGCHVIKWPAHLAALKCQIAMAPLVQHPFNESKSELKVLESWALGIPIIASDIAPYRRAITDGHNGILCSENPDLWFNEVRRLIESPELRSSLATDGLATLNDRYVMTKVVDQYERALLTIARGKTNRPICNAAMEKRLEEKGWI